MKPWFWKTACVLVIVGLSADVASADTFTVACPADSLNAAVMAAKSASPSGPHTINVAGACVENVSVIDMSNLTIQGSPGASLTGAAGGGNPQAVLLVQNSQSFRLNDMIVNGVPSRQHAVAFTAANGVVQGSTIQGAPQNGLLIQNTSSVNVRNSTIQNNGANGILAVVQSAVNAQGTTIIGNGASGLVLAMSASGSLNGDDPSTPSVVERIEIANSAFSGISVNGASSLSGSGAHLIHHNALSGVRVSGGSNVSFGGQSSSLPMEIYQNGSRGIEFLNSNGGVFNTIIRENNQNPTAPGNPFTDVCGVCAEAGSSIFAVETQITNNAGDGLHIGRNSYANMRSITITGNTGNGIRINLASGFEFVSPSTAPTPGTPTDVSGNGGASVNCGDNLSWVAGDLAGVGKPIKCAEIKIK